MDVSRRKYFCLLLNCLLFSFQGSQVADSAEKPSSSTSSSPLIYEDTILPIFQAHCLKCHNTKNRKAEFDVSSPAALLKGGESGAGLVAGKPDESLLYEYLHDGQMPPEGSRPLSAEDLQLIHNWIAQGMKFQQNPQVSSEALLSQHDVLPILYRRCVMCHGPEYQEGGLDVRTKADMLKGGNAGAAIIAGKPDESLLVKYIVEKTCPPKAELSRAGIEPMTAEELASVKDWIAQGLNVVTDEPQDFNLDQDPLVTKADRQFWSFQPPQQVEPPLVKQQSLVKNPVDAFLLRKL
ncbi:MAG: hypothetical protein CME31_26760, partial [Gimesia sp.]|nr:hypothetical protein [Gimesia sp.]